MSHGVSFPVLWGISLYLHVLFIDLVIYDKKYIDNGKKIVNLILYVNTMGSFRITFTSFGFL